jgi:hypothetical protein
MESADTTSAGQGKEPEPNKSSRTAVLPDAVGPKNSPTGIGDMAGTGVSSGIADLFLHYAEFDLLGKDLAGREGNHLAVIFFYIRVLQHGKLEGSTGSGAGNFIHITVVFD